MFNIQLNKLENNKSPKNKKNLKTQNGFSEKPYKIDFLTYWQREIHREFESDRERSKEEGITRDTAEILKNYK